MATYGLRVINELNGKPLVLDGGMRFLSYLGYTELRMARNSATIAKALPSGHTPLIIPRSMASIATTNTNSITHTISSLSLSGNTVNYSYEPTYDFDGPLGSVDVFSVSGAEPQGGYGLRVVNGSNFMEINDTSYLGYVTYVATININGVWGIPADIYNRGDYCVFARFQSPDVSLHFDRAANQLRACTGFGSANGSGNGVINGVQIVIVSCGRAAEYPTSGYGMVIRNAAGQITFSTKFPPVMWGGAYYAIPAERDYGGGGDGAKNWINPTGSVTAPMIPLCQMGTSRGDYGRSAGGYTYRIVMKTGFVMNGNSVSVCRTVSAGGESVDFQSPRRQIAAANLPCLDAALYF